MYQLQSKITFGLKYMLDRVRIYGNVFFDLGVRSNH